MAAVKREPMGADLLRQRRNLLITSLVLIAINLAGATVKSDVSVLGASVQFANPERIVWGAWVLWAYFFIRYWQYLNEEPDLGIHKGMENWIFRKFSWDVSDNEYEHWIAWRYFIYWNLYEHHERWEDDEWAISSQDPKDIFRKVAWTCLAFFQVATKTPRFTDYGAPFLVALIPLILVVWNFLESP